MWFDNPDIDVFSVVWLCALEVWGGERALRTMRSKKGCMPTRNGLAIVTDQKLANVIVQYRPVLHRGVAPFVEVGVFGLSSSPDAQSDVQPTVSRNLLQSQQENGVLS